MKKRFSVIGLIGLSVTAAGLITLAFFIGSWTGGSGKVEIAGAFGAVPEAITGTTSRVEYKISIPGTSASIAGVSVVFSSPSRYVIFEPVSGSVTTDSNGVAGIEVIAKADAPTWLRTTTIEATCTVGDLNVSGKTEPLSIKAG